jgi:hypothetical protein
MQWLYASGGDGGMKEHEADLEAIGDGIAHLLGSIIMNKKHYSPTQMIEIRAAAMRAFKAKGRTQALLAAEFDGVAVTGAADVEDDGH